MCSLNYKTWHIIWKKGHILIYGLETSFCCNRFIFGWIRRTWRKSSKQFVALWHNLCLNDGAWWRKVIIWVRMLWERLLSWLRLCFSLFSWFFIDFLLLEHVSYVGLRWFWRWELEILGGVGIGSMMKLRNHMVFQWTDDVKFVANQIILVIWYILNWQKCIDWITRAFGYY